MDEFNTFPCTAESQLKDKIWLERLGCPTYKCNLIPLIALRLTRHQLRLQFDGPLRVATGDRLESGTLRCGTAVACYHSVGLPPRHIVLTAL